MEKASEQVIAGGQRVGFLLQIKGGPWHPLNGAGVPHSKLASALDS